MSGKQAKAGIRLIAETERLTYKVEGSVIYYRRVPADVRSRIIRANTVRGTVNWEGVSSDMLDYAVTGWDNVRDLAGNPTPFSSNLIGTLPERCRVDIVDLAFSATNSEDEPDPTKGSAST